MAIEEARQARHDIRHHFVQLSSLAEQGDMEKIKKYLSATTEKISDYNLHFCENQAVDSVFGYYSTLAKRENIPFHALVSLPTDLSIDEKMCIRDRVQTAHNSFRSAQAAEVLKSSTVP